MATGHPHARPMVVERGAQQAGEVYTRAWGNHGGCLEEVALGLMQPLLWYSSDPLSGVVW